MSDVAPDASIAVVASLNVDHIVTAPRIPAPGETILGTDSAKAFGGKGGNQAVAAARLGPRVAVIGCVGDDEDGHEYLDALESERIDVDHVDIVPGTSTGLAAITVAEDGANSIVVVPGANAKIRAGEAAAAIAEMPGLRVVVGQAEAAVEATEAAFRAARERGIITLLNPAPVNDAARRLLPLADIIVPNEVEFEQLTGQSALDEAALGRGAARLLDQGPRWVVVTLGAQGSVAIDRSGISRIPPRPVRVVDTTAAGDSYVGTLAAVLASPGTIEVPAMAERDATPEGQKELADPLSHRHVSVACVLAASAAAHTVTVAGAQPSLPFASELGVWA